MQRAEKSCSQCRARKTKCDLNFPHCLSCTARDLHCEFGKRRKPGPPKGYREHVNRRRAGHVLSKECPDRPPARAHGPEHHGALKTPSTPAAYLGDAWVAGLDLLAEEMPFARRQDSLKRELTDLENYLVDMYLSLNLFPLLPPFRGREHLTQGGDNETCAALTNAVCAISIHCNAARLTKLSPTCRIRAGDIFARRAKAFFVRHVTEQTVAVTLDLVKLAVLLAMYDMTCGAGLKGCYMVGEAVRLAYDMGLDQVDSSRQSIASSISVEEAEDRRYVWWCVYCMDLYSSSLLLRPFSIDDININTAMVSTTEHQFKSGAINSRRGYSLPSDLSQLQVAVKSLDHNDPVSTQTLYVLVLSLGRLMIKSRRQQLEGRDVDHQFTLFQNTLATIWFSLPDKFVEPCLFSGDSHIRVMRIEIVILLHLASINLQSYALTEVLFPQPHGSSAAPNFRKSNGSLLMLGGNTKLFQGSWQKCIQSAKGMVELISGLTPQELCMMSPGMAGALWHPGLVLVLNMKSSTSPAEIAYSTSAVEMIKAALSKLGTSWKIGQSFHDAIELLSSRITATPTESDICDILQSYTSALISVNCGEIKVHIPSLVIPEKAVSVDPELWSLPDDCMFGPYDISHIFAETFGQDSVT